MPIKMASACRSAAKRHGVCCHFRQALKWILSANVAPSDPEDGLWSVFSDVAYRCRDCASEFKHTPTPRMLLQPGRRTNVY
jgi:hypothetical protein